MKTEQENYFLFLFVRYSVGFVGHKPDSMLLCRVLGIFTYLYVSDTDGNVSSEYAAQSRSDRL